MKKIAFNRKWIGIFDSGVGGLTVFKAIREVLPRENLIYFGDLARVPYGGKSPQLVRKYAEEITRYLLKQREIKAIVVACNTASSVSLSYLRKKFSLPILGVIEPGVKKALQTTRNNHIGVIGTITTIKSGAYQRLIQERNRDISLLALPTPLFVPLVEEGWIDEEVTRMVARKYLNPFLQAGVDTLILGCTHYPLLKNILAEEGRGISLIDSSREVAEELRKLLKREGIEGGEGKELFLLTDTPPHFPSLFQKFLKKSPSSIKEVKLEELS